MFIAACVYQTEKGGPMKDGVAIGPNDVDIKTIIDKQTCLPIPADKMWDFDMTFGRLCVHFD